MELVYIEWEDASCADDGVWVPRDAPKAEATIFKQVGFVCGIDAAAVVLTEAYGGHQMAPRTRIPLGMVRRFEYLKVGGAHERRHRRAPEGVRHAGAGRVHRRDQRARLPDRGGPR